MRRFSVFFLLSLFALSCSVGESEQRAELSAQGSYTLPGDEPDDAPTRQATERAFEILVDASQALIAPLPDTQKGLESLAAFIEQHEAEMAELGAVISAQRHRWTSREQQAFIKTIQAKYAAEIVRYLEAMTAFEELASDKELLHLNALMKGFTQPFLPPQD